MSRCAGARNRIYESHCFGSTFVWDEKTLQIATSPDSCTTPEVVVLSTLDGSAREGSGLESGRMTVEFFADPDGVGSVDRGRTRLGQIEKSNSNFDLQSLSDSNRPAVRGTIQLESNGASQQIDVISGQHNFPKVGSAGPHIVVVTWEGTSDSSGENLLWNEVFDSVNEPAPNWETCHGVGVIEVRRSTHEITDDSANVQLVLSNVDVDPAIFRASAVRLVEIDVNDPSNTLLVKPNPDNGEYEIPTNLHDKGEVPVELTFTEGTRGREYTLVYLQPTRMITLHTFNKILPGSGRPRINPGG